ncbi:Flp family type IVb pilin [Thermomicrobium sp. 4228-Ro]|uniref:Flp family type IVb pilin n=1 Tax=Thermomicrobium sp. 4228-Ro TaxID=2993937 RepID=UPI00224906F7|nr:Flp family type IVb pilin [Thermomicrobium sp. 4228-Ro]MCX2727278.1 Flp family type IVb pilin [Thermomicrobium sp. 4228-Ro]
MRYLYDILAWYEVQKQRAMEGQSLVEYGLILALVALVVIGALTLIGQNINGLLTNIAGKLGG